MLHILIFITLIFLRIELVMSLGIVEIYEAITTDPISGDLTTE